ncbi:MAG: serine kinase [Rhodanobacteraceae bacterium]
MQLNLPIDSTTLGSLDNARDRYASDEYSGVGLSVTKRLLGGRFRFESASTALLQLVEAAYGGLPRHGFPISCPEFRIELRLAMPRHTPAGVESAPVQTQTRTNRPSAVIDASNYVVIAPEKRFATVVISEDTLAHPYHVRYGLIEFAVFILAARGLGLAPLHGACVGLNGRGVLLLGASGSGKTTLALHALLGGFELVAEDAVFVQPERMLATGVPNYLHLTKDTLRFVDDETRRWISGSPVIRRRSGVEKFEVDLRQGPRRLAKTPLELAGAVFVSSRPADGSKTMHRIPSGKIDSLLSVDQPYAMTQPGWRDFSRRLKQLGVYELGRQHPQDALQHLRRLLGQSF